MQQVAFLCRFHLTILKDVNFAIFVQICVAIAMLISNVMLIF